LDKLRIGIHNSTITDYSGGGLYYLNSLIYGLNKYTNNKIVVYYEDDKYKKYIFESNNIEWKFIENKRIFCNKIINGTRLIFGKKILNSHWDKNKYGEKPDLIISQESLIGFYMGIEFVGFIGDVMYKYYPGLEEYSYLKRFIRNLATKSIVKMSSKLVVDSEYASNDIIKFFKCQKSKLEVIPLCAPPHFQNISENKDFFNKKLLQKKYKLPKKYLLYPSQFWEHKNHINLLKSFNKAIQEGLDINLVLLGSKDWPLFKEINKMIISMSLTDRVKTLGYVSDEDILGLYKFSRALIYPSYADYTGIPLIEAMMLGKPIIASNTFAIPEQVGNAGLFFDPHNVEDIKEKIVSICTDNSLYEKLSVNSKNRSKIFSIKIFSESWNSLIQKSIK
jgi:glycosyltransferase involved in cell wall biosynthesis